MKPVETLMTNRKGVIAYLLIAFGIAWILWEGVFRLGASLNPIVKGVLMLPTAFAPAIATFVVRKWITREGFADAGLRLNLRKWPYYIVAWLLPLLILGCIVVLAPLFKAGKPDFSFARGIHFLVQLGYPEWLFRYPALLILYWLITAIPKSLVLFGEEFGWRGYLQLRLFPHAPVLSAVGTGVIWAVWHYPMTLRGFNYPDHPVIGSLLVFPVSCIFMSIIFGWLRLQSGSIWCCSLAHSATNVIEGGLFILLFGGGGNFMVVSPAGLLGWIPLGALSAWIVFTGQLKPASEVLSDQPSVTAQALGRGTP